MKKSIAHSSPTHPITPEVKRRKTYIIAVVLFVGATLTALLAFDFLSIADFFKLSQSPSPLSAKIEQLQHTVGTLQQNLAQQQELTESLHQELHQLKATPASKASKDINKKVLWTFFFSRLERATQKGDPYQPLLDHLESVLPAAISVERLRFFALSGMPSDTELAQQSLTAITSKEKPSPYLWERLLQFLSQLIRVRKTEGDTPTDDEIFSLLRAGRLTEALPLLQQKTTRDPTFIKLIEKKIEAQKNLEDLEAFILSQLKDK